MRHVVHVPYTVEQDEDGVWCAHAQLRPRVGAHGDGDSPDAAIADLREEALAHVPPPKIFNTEKRSSGEHGEHGVTEDTEKGIAR